MKAPKPTYSQVEQRERRLKLLRFDYDGTFALDLEISGLLGPLAAKVATLPKNPLARAGEVAEAHAAAVGVLAWVVTVAGRGAPAARAVAMMAPGEVDDAAIRDGSWTDGLMSAARSLAPALASALDSDQKRPARAHPGDSMSDQLKEALGPLDEAAKVLRVRTDNSAKLQALEPLSVREARRKAARRAAGADKLLTGGGCDVSSKLTRCARCGRGCAM